MSEEIEVVFFALIKLRFRNNSDLIVWDNHDPQCYPVLELFDVVLSLFGLMLYYTKLLSATLLLSVKLVEVVKTGLLS